jgi:hypothetical protein
METRGSGLKALKQPGAFWKENLALTRRGRLGRTLTEDSGPIQGKDLLAKKVSLIKDRPLDLVSMLSGN